MRREEIHEANRTASVELVTSLGYEPADVLDRGDGRLEFDGTCVVLKVIEWERRGVPRRSGEQQIVTHTVRVEITAERLAAYRKAVARA